MTLSQPRRSPINSANFVLFQQRHAVPPHLQTAPRGGSRSKKASILGNVGPGVPTTETPLP